MVSMYYGTYQSSVWDDYTKIIAHAITNTHLGWWKYILYIFPYNCKHSQVSFDISVTI